jgi:predicted TIM-barrel fold metal-dependent hydrolase
MKIEDLIIVSVDDHVIEPPDMFDRHLPPEIRDRGPQLKTAEDGSNFWIFDDMVVANMGLSAVVGRPQEEYGCEPMAFSQMREGAYQIDKRVDDMNVNGILGSICFGTFAQFDGGFFRLAKDKKLANRVVQAYNDWHIQDWAGKAPGRFIPMAMLPMWDVNLVVAEIKRVVAMGCQTIAFPDNPAARGLPSLHNAYWEPMWQVCSENNVPICCHIGTGSVSPHASMETPIEAWIATMPMAIANGAADWVYLEAFKRYPNLKVVLSEGGIGWIPYLMERLDFTYKHHRAWTHVDFGDKLPSDVFREHIITCFIDDKFGLANTAAIGIDNICYECDYPHPDTVWPRSPELLLESLGSLSDQEIDKVTHLNAMRIFNYDPFSILGRQNCTVGALRAKAAHVNTTPVSMGGAKPLEDGVIRRVTSGDVVKLYAANVGQAADAA